MNKAPASLDVKKLFAFQARYMQAVPLTEKVEMVLPYLTRAGLPTDREFVAQVVEAAGPRIKVAGDILDYDYFFLPDEQIAFDPAMATKHLSRVQRSGRRSAARRCWRSCGRWSRQPSRSRTIH